MILKQINLILVFLFITSYSFSQTLSFQHLTTEDGLGSNSVNCIFQDSKGYIWIGTSDGLNKYDGTRFTIYKSIPNIPTTISGNYILSIAEDKEGNLWFGTYKTGLNRFDPLTERFTRFRRDSKDTNSLPDDWVQFLASDIDGNIYCSSFEGVSAIFRYDKTKNKFFYFFKGDQFFIDTENILWIASKDGIFKCDITKKSSEKLNIHGIIGACFAQDKNDNIWLGNLSDSMICYNLHTKMFSKYHIPFPVEKLEIKSIRGDQEGNVWFGTRVSGLLKFDVKTRMIIQYKSDPSNKNGLNSDSPYSVFVDRAGVLWVGSYGNGLNIYSEFKNKFYYLKHNPNKTGGLDESIVNSICEDKFGRIWITGAIKLGINIWDRRRGTFKFIPYSFLGNGAKMPTFYLDNSDQLFISANRIFLFNEQKDRIVEHRISSLSYAEKPNLKFQGKDGNYWISTDLGIVKYNKDNKSIKKYYSESFKKIVSSAEWISSCEDRTGIIWMGTQHRGLFSLDPKSEIITNYLNNPSDDQSISHNHISCIYEDSKGILWIATRGGGLNRMDREIKKFERFLEGLPNEEIYGILEDWEGNLWLSTNNGLSKFNPKTKKFKNYNVSDGLLNNEFNSDGYYRSKSGEMFFGCMGGIIYFHPDKMIENKNPPKVIITLVKVFDSIVCRDIYSRDTLSGFKNLSNRNRVELPYDRNFLTFEFAAIDYNDTKRNEYAYQLEGIDKEYVQCGNRSFANYPNLPSGEYIFRVIASNNDGVWNRDGISLTLIINPPFWRTWWAYSFYALFIVFSIVSTIKLRERNLINNQKKLENEVSLRTNELKVLNENKNKLYRIISHDMRNVFWASFQGSEEIQVEYDNLNEGRRKELIRRIYESSKYSNELLSSLLNWIKTQERTTEIKSESINLKSFTDNILNSLLMHANKKGITLINNSQEITIISDKTMLSSVIQNLIANAIKYSKNEDTVEIRTEKNEIYFTIIISDTGVGIRKEILDVLFDIDKKITTTGTDKEHGTGFGLKICMELVKKMDGNLWVESEHGKGSKFFVKLPNIIS